MVKHFLSILVLVLGLGCIRENKEVLPRPNILFIMSDDHAFQAISAYNQKLIDVRNEFEKYKEKMQEYDFSTDLDDIVHHQINDQILAHADAVMTDTWKSMGEDTKNEDYDLIKEFRVTEKVMKIAKSDSIFMHCLPANRNEEVEASVIDGNNSRVWQEASNRLFVQKEILKVIF